jgi:hypothetical protein
VHVRRGFIAGFAAIAALIAGAREARAGDMDPTPERLVQQPPGLPPGQTCQSAAADPAAVVAAGARPQDLACLPNNVAFQNMMAELGFAIAPSAFTPARTTGVGGFSVSLEASYTRISSDRNVTNPDGSLTPFWKLGTRGPQDPNTKQYSVINASPDSLIQIYTLKARKGLPLGFEIAGALGYVANTSMWVGGGDLRWSLLEGFRQGALGVFPDVSVGAGVRTLSGTSKFYLTTVGLDVKVSKPITLADSAQLIPSIGFQRLYIFGDSNVLDATPSVDALQQCGYEGPNPANGAPVCRNKLPNGADANGDFANNFTFDAVRVHRNKAMVGMHYRYELLWLGTQFAADVNPPKDENPNLVVNRQWTLSFEGGVFF